MNPTLIHPAVRRRRPGRPHLAAPAAQAPPLDQEQTMTVFATALRRRRASHAFVVTVVRELAPQSAGTGGRLRLVAASEPLREPARERLGRGSDRTAAPVHTPRCGRARAPAWRSRRSAGAGRGSRAARPPAPARRARAAPANPTRPRVERSPRGLSGHYGPRRKPRYERLTIPVLVFTGTNGPPPQRLACERLAVALTGASVTWLEALGHVCQRPMRACVEPCADTE
jgi:hypothetical protein